MSNLIFRPHTWDENIWKSVTQANEYNLADRCFHQDDSILDIGAHIGSFAYACLDRGAGRVTCVESDPDNFQLLRHNLHEACKATDRAVLISAAAVGRPRRHVFSAAVGTNTGGTNTLGSDGTPVAAIAVKELLEIAVAWKKRRVRLVKIDCEGAEWDILANTDMGSVNALVGEYHEILDPKQFPELELESPRDKAWLEKELRQQGFEVITSTSGNGLGLFWAWREGKEFFNP